jgi:colanic acid biosynthesis protein WcaH
MEEQSISGLSSKDFLQLIKTAPLISVDLIIRNSRGEYLLGLRKNKPAQDCWFVVGSRIHKGERIEDALDRIIKQDLNSCYKDLVIQNRIAFKKVYEHNYKDNFFGKAGFGTQYIVLAYEVDLDVNETNISKAENTQYKWFSKDEILRDSKVHFYTKAYFLDIEQKPELDLYESMMYHYLHYEGQMWSRTQLLIAVEGAVLTLFVTKPDFPFTFIALAFGSLIIRAIMILIYRDEENRNVNKDMMDLLSASSLSLNGFKGVIRLRSDVSNGKLKGGFVLRFTLWTFLILNNVLLLLWVFRINLY